MNRLTTTGTKEVPERHQFVSQWIKNVHKLQREKHCHRFLVCTEKTYFDLVVLMEDSPFIMSISPDNAAM